MAESDDSNLNTKASGRRKISVPQTSKEKKPKDITRERSKISNENDEPAKVYFDPTIAKKSLKRSFVLTLVVGSIVILTPMPFFALEGVIKIAISAILMGIYYLAGMKYIRSPNTNAVFADSLYYLGFLFTFVALVGAMTALNELNIQSIVGQMGPALVTTVIGMTARIYLTQFEPITSEPETEAISAMSNLSAQLITSLKNLEDVQKSSLNEIKKFSDNLNDLDFSRLQKNFNDLGDEVGYLTKSSKDLKGLSERTKITVESTQNEFASLGETFSEAKKKVESLDTSIGVIQELDEKVENASRAFTAVGEKLETKVSFSATEATNAITLAAREAEKAKTEATKLTKTLGDTVNNVAEFLNRQK